jgi:hypothetical protein
MLVMHRRKWLFCQLSIGLTEFPDLIRAHRLSDPTTPTVEAHASKFVKSGFPQSDTKAFIEAVCIWGNWPGIAARVQAPKIFGPRIGRGTRQHHQWASRLSSYN